MHIQQPWITQSKTLTCVQLRGVDYVYELERGVCVP